MNEEDDNPDEEHYDDLKEMCQIRCKVCDKDIYSCLMPMHVSKLHPGMRGIYGDYEYSRVTYHR